MGNNCFIPSCDTHLYAGDTLFQYLLTLCQGILRGKGLKIKRASGKTSLKSYFLL